MSEERYVRSEENAGGRVCPCCGNDGEAGRIWAVFTELEQISNTEDLLTAECSCEACGMQWTENSVTDHVVYDSEEDFEDKDDNQEPEEWEDIPF